MAGLYNDDESTDDELGMNLLLAERLSINRGESSNCKEDESFENSKDFKQLCNMRRKQYAQGGQSSSSSSLEAQNGDTASVLMWYVFTIFFKKDLYTCVISYENAQNML